MASAGKGSQPDAPAVDVKSKETPQQRHAREYDERHATRSRALAWWGITPPIGRPYQTDQFGHATGIGGDEKLRFLMIGLDAAGKTTITYRLAEGAPVVTTIPTIGFNVETVELPTARSAGVASDVTVWDVGGRDKIRPLWRHYYVMAHAVIFVVDSNDRDRIDDARDYEHSAMEELMRLMDEDEIKGKPVLVIANKQDLPNAMTPAQVTKALCFPTEALWEGAGKGESPRAAVEADLQPLVRYLLLGKTAFEAERNLELLHRRPLTARARAAANAGRPGPYDGWLPVESLMRMVMEYVSYAPPYLRVVGCSATTDIAPAREGFEWLCEAVYARANLQPPARAPRGLLSNCTLM